MLPIQNDVIVFGILMLLLGLIFKTASSELPFWKNFYKYVPSVLLCYLLPSFLRLFGVVDEEMVGKLYGMAKNYLLPASLVLMTLSIDFKGLARLGGHSLAMFFTATIGIVIGGPIAVLIVGFFSPETFQVAQESDEIWRGLSTLAGSWIGGGANQAAMLEVYEYNEKLYSGMVAVDIIVANLLMAFLLLGAGRTEAIDKWLGADSSKIEELKKSIETYRAKIAKIPTLSNLMVVLAVGFGAVGFSHLVSGFMLDLVFDSPALKASILGSGFFWVVVTATTIGLILSFTKARELEGVGASRIGSVCI
ncbi:MAG: putative membrane protein, partial [Bacteroidia bacterium]